MIFNVDKLSVVLINDFNDLGIYYANKLWHFKQVIFITYLKWIHKILIDDNVKNLLFLEKDLSPLTQMILNKAITNPERIEEVLHIYFNEESVAKN